MIFRAREIINTSQRINCDKMRGAHEVPAADELAISSQVSKITERTAALMAQKYYLVQAYPQRASSCTCLLATLLHLRYTL